MNILLAFKAEPDLAGMAESAWLTPDDGGPDTTLLRCEPGVDEQAAAALLLENRAAGHDLRLTALSIGDERALHWLRHFAALGFDERVLLETTADLRFDPAFVAGQLAVWQQRCDAGMIVTGCQSSEGQNGQTPWLLAERLGWPCLTQVERFTLAPPFVTVEQRTETGSRQCRARLPAVIAVRQYGDAALPVPGMRQRLAANRAEIVREPVTPGDAPPVTCLNLQRKTQQRDGHIIQGNSVQEKAQTLWDTYLRPEMRP
jgi:electron transfer flavoprotein alpha/beta subunit